MIYIVTKAYNAKTTLSRTIESVLSQTYGDFTYYVCNNGSNDETEEIIRYYSRLDKRVILINQTINNTYSYDKNKCWDYEYERYIERLMFYIGEEDWYSILDSDDDLDKDFFNEMCMFAEDEKLDFVACRSNHIKEPEGISNNEVVINEDIIIQKEGFGTLFPSYFRYMGACWGKLQKGSLFSKINKSYFEKWISELSIRTRIDTAKQLFFLSYSEKAGVKAKLLHNYHIYPKGKSLSTQRLDEKISDNLKMPDIYREYLTKKVGYVSDNNERYIQEVFERSQRRTKEEMKQS